MKAQNDVLVRVPYGIGAAVTGRLPMGLLAGVPAREVIQRVIATPQDTDPARRTARVLADVLRTGRRIDVEVSASADDSAIGEPIRLEDVALPRKSTGSYPASDTLTIRVSEEYRGG